VRLTSATRCSYARSVETQCPGCGFVLTVESDEPFHVTWDGPIDWVYIAAFICTSVVVVDAMRLSVNGQAVVMPRRGRRPNFRDFSLIIHTCARAGGHADDRAAIKPKPPSRRAST
jgi:hypothetical protein